MCILNHHAAHIYLCGDVRRTVYGQNIQNLCRQMCIPLPGTMEKYTNNIQNLCRQRYIPLSRKFPYLCSACVIKINIGTNHGFFFFFFTKISISCELCSAFVIIIKAHKGNVVTGHGLF